MLSIQTHTHGHTPPPCPLSFLRFLSFVGLSLTLFRLFLRLVSLPQSRAKYSFYIFLRLSFSLALLALLFLCFFLLFLTLFRYLFRLSTHAPPSGTVCVSLPVPKGTVFPHFGFRQGRVTLFSYHTQRSCGEEWEGKLGQFPVPARQPLITL